MNDNMNNSDGGTVAKVGITPGPWEVQRYSTHTGFSVWAAGRGCIAERWYDREQNAPYGAEIDANAQAIAALPELVKTLQRVNEALIDILTHWQPVKLPNGKVEAEEAMIMAVEEDLEAVAAALEKAGCL